MKNEITIEFLKTYSPEVLENFNRLLSQLDSNIPKLEELYVREVLQTANTCIFVARKNNGVVVGMLTLIMFKALSSRRATMEDLVVDKDYRRQGLGTKLLETAISFARKKDIAYIDFTSRPSRIEANSLYLSLGFKKRDTNAYRYIIK